VLFCSLILHAYMINCLPIVGMDEMNHQDNQLQQSKISSSVGNIH
jgi:hypothetical protein